MGYRVTGARSSRPSDSTSDGDYLVNIRPDELYAKRVRMYRLFKP